jgi:leucyl aminopeptidase
MEQHVTAPKLALTEGDLSTTAADAVVVGTLQGADGLELAPGAEAVDAAFDGALLEVLGTLRATGKADELVKVPTFGKITAPLLLAVGLGRTAGEEQVRRASGVAARAANEAG